MAKLSDRNKNLTFVPSPQSPDSAGFVKETADDVVPDGWLECNGQVVEQADYPELFEKIGTTYNTGGETGTQFRLPGGSLLTNASVDGTLDVSGNTTMSGTLDVAGDVEIVTSDLVVDTNTLVTSGGSVGIGTNSPLASASLDVSGDVIIGDRLRIGDTSATPVDTLDVRADVTPRLRLSADNSGGAAVPGISLYNSSTFEGGLFWNEARDNVEFFTSASGIVPQMVIDSSTGNVGIGTTGPDNTFTVQQAQTAGADFNGAHMRLKADTTTNTTGHTSIAFSTSGLSNFGMSLNVIRTSTSGSPQTFTIREHNNSAAGSEVFRLQSNGEAFFTDSPGTFTSFGSGAVRIRGQAGMTLDNRSTSSSSRNQIEFYDASGDVNGSITSIATSNTTAYNTSSDARLKTNITTFDALSMVALMNPVQYNRIGDLDAGVNRLEYGFLAQELHAVLPQAVQEGGDNPSSEPWQVDYAKLTGVLCKAIQELNDKITALEAANV